MKTPPEITIRHDPNDKVLAFAARELKHFIHQTSNYMVGINPALSHAVPAYTFRLQPDPEMKPGSFRICSGPEAITLSGADSACVLHAAYRALERMGCHFTISSPLLPARLDPEALSLIDETVVPFALHRGVRQHINFPMDVSAWSVHEAREYIRDMARLKFNHITFHSYNGQWFPYRSDAQEFLAGNFFYSNRHEIPDDDVVRPCIRNRKAFWIPEVEEIMDDPAKRSDFAVAWLTSLMEQAKECGMTVQLSIEPPRFTDAENVRICEAVVRLYPMIDIFELVTPECGGEKLQLTATQEIDLMAECFGEETRKDAELTGLFEDNQRQLTGVLKNAALAIRAAAGLDRRLFSELGVKLAIGTYATEHKTLRIIKKLMDDYVPADVSRTFLPAHGAAAVNASVAVMDFNARDLERTLLYTWAEFDGSMFLLQNPSNAMRELILHAHGITGGGQIYGICVNHWKTAENKTCFGVASAVFVDPTVTVAECYKRLADAYGIARRKPFFRALQGIDKADVFARDKLFNIGFVSSGGMGRRYSEASLDEALKMNRAVVRDLAACFSGYMHPYGREFVRFMKNRVECSIEHLTVTRINSDLHAIHDGKTPADLTAAERETVRAKCAEAAFHAAEYCRKQAEFMPDRGSEGNLINYHKTVPPYFAGIDAAFGGGKAVEGKKTGGAQSPQAEVPQAEIPPAPMEA